MNAVDGKEAKAGKRSGNYGVCKGKFFIQSHTPKKQLPISNATKEYCGFGDGRIEYDSSGATERFYLKDHLGSTRAVIDGNGTLVEAVSYDAYGAIIRSEILAGVEEPTKEKFTGKEYDTSGFVAGGIACGLQLDYFGARYYDPETGVWTIVDPGPEGSPKRIDGRYSSRTLREGGMLKNSYGYCFDDPVDYFDPDGRWGLAHAIITLNLVLLHGWEHTYTEFKEGKIGAGIGELLKNIFIDPMEATGVSFASVLPDIEKMLHVGEGRLSGAHGLGSDYDTYVKGEQENVNRNKEWYQFFKRWYYMGHLAHTAEDSKIHRTFVVGTPAEDIIEFLDWNPFIAMFATFNTQSQFEGAVYGNGNGD
jgi:RHS repeat-associated protein